MKTQKKESPKCSTCGAPTEPTSNLSYPVLKQDCGKNNTELHADHYIKSFAQIIADNKITSVKKAIACKELWDINNGRTLCIKCHKKTPTYLKPLSIHPRLQSQPVVA